MKTNRRSKEKERRKKGGGKQEGGRKSRVGLSNRWAKWEGKWQRHVQLVQHACFCCCSWISVKRAERRAVFTRATNTTQATGSHLSLLTESCWAPIQKPQQAGILHMTLRDHKFNTQAEWRAHTQCNAVAVNNSVGNLWRPDAEITVITD